MKIALSHDHFDAAHLAAVKAEMQTLGSPVIRAVRMECWGIWVALEGCHRIRAAKELGLLPVIYEVEYSDTVTTDDLGLDMGGDSWTVAELADRGNETEVMEF